MERECAKVNFSYLNSIFCTAQLRFSTLRFHSWGYVSACILQQLNFLSQLSDRGDSRTRWLSTHGWTMVHGPKFRSRPAQLDRLCLSPNPAAQLLSDSWPTLPLTCPLRLLPSGRRHVNYSCLTRSPTPTLHQVSTADFVRRYFFIKVNL